MKLELEMTDELADEIFATVLNDTTRMIQDEIKHFERKHSVENFEVRDFIANKEYLTAAKIVAEFHGVPFEDDR
jgi:hypothetical protein